MPLTGTALARFPAFVRDQVEDLGLDRSWLLQQAQLSERDLADRDARIHSGKNIRLWGAVLAAVGDRDQLRP